PGEGPAGQGRVPQVRGGSRRSGEGPAGLGECPAGLGEGPAGQGECLAGLGECPAGQGECPAGLGECPAGQGECPAGLGECPAAPNHSQGTGHPDPGPALTQPHCTMTSLRAGRRALALVLLVVLQLQACRGQGTAELRKPIYQRLRRLDDQFRRFQEQTLSRLDLLNHVSNVSTPLEVRVQTLSDQHRNLTQELTQLRDTTIQELDILKDRSSKLQKKNKRMEGRLASLERGLRHRQGQGSRQTQRLSQEQGESLSSLTLELHSQEGRLDSLEAQREELLVGLRGLQESLREQGLRMSRLEGRLGELLQGNVISSRGSERTGDPITSNLTPQDTAPPRRTQASRGQSPRQDTQTYYQPQPQANTQPYSQPHPQPHSQPKHTKDRRMRTRLQPPPPHPTQPPSQSQEERKRLGERGQESPGLR
uniref:pentraxin-4-like n=1 Tax=Oncorhynchus gorbuscha TaxID=8017 RepID=UPI001EAED70D